MRPDLPSLLPLVCPACRTRTETELELHTVELERVERTSPDGDVETGVLRCGNCRRCYPVVGGIPVLLTDVPARMSADFISFAEEELSPGMLAACAEPGPDDTPVARGLEHLSIYMDAHWGDRAEPPPDGPAGAQPDLHARIAAARPVPRTVELGCSVGRGVHAAAGELVVGLDVSLPSLRRARRLLRGERVTYARRRVGRHYDLATVNPPDPRPASFLCGDAMDPPLAPGSFDRVLALNLVDAVAHPAQILSVADALCAPGGEIHLASPFNWQTGIVAEDGRLGADAPVDWFRRTFEKGAGLQAKYQIVEEADVAWALRRDARSAVLYRTWYVVARRERQRS